jgi:hypothetical protein
MKKISGKNVTLGAIVVLALIQLIQPSRTNPQAVPSKALEAHEQVPADVQAILKRSCYDCHSNSTVWPWYSHVAPVSWYLAHHVNGGRRHVNFQDWEAQENPKEAHEHLGLTCKLVREGDMPPADYRLIHEGTRLSPSDVNTVCAWTKQFDSDEGAHHHED